MKYSVIILLEERHEDFNNFIRNLHEVFSNLREPFEMLIVANGLGGVFLSSSFGKTKDIYKWKCKILDHPPFEKSYANVVYSGNFCPLCRDDQDNGNDWYENNKKMINMALSSLQ